MVSAWAASARKLGGICIEFDDRAQEDLRHSLQEVVGQVGSIMGYQRTLDDMMNHMSRLEEEVNVQWQEIGDRSMQRLDAMETQLEELRWELSALRDDAEVEFARTVGEESEELNRVEGPVESESGVALEGVAMERWVVRVDVAWLVTLAIWQQQVLRAHRLKGGQGVWSGTRLESALKWWCENLERGCEVLADSDSGSDDGECRLNEKRRR